MEQLLQQKLIEPRGPLEGSVITKVTSVAGGCIHQTWQLQMEDGHKIFAKTCNEASWQMLQCECKGLNELRKWAEPSLIEIPEPLALEKFDKSAVLLMPWLDLQQGNQKKLGQGLAKIHKYSKKNGPGKFGWNEDSYIGLGPQPGGWRKNWGECFVELRLIPQLKIASKWGLSTTKLDEVKHFLITLLNEHDPSPSLVHGDLWSGNASVLGNGSGVLLDPATWWADREVDLAMTKLFGGFSDEFYKGYELEWPISSSAKKRVEIYNFYHLLNHANLFGGSYISQCISYFKDLESLSIS